MDYHRETQTSESSGLSSQNGAPPPGEVPSPPVETPVFRGSRPVESESIRPTAEGLPIWMQRAFLVVFVILCIELGVVLMVAPWTPVWTDNRLFLNFPQLRTFLRLGFVRGMVSGVGLLDIWIGIWEAVHYKDRRNDAKFGN
jgi:hypothetical protein